MIGFAVIVGAFVSRPVTVAPINLTLGFVTGSTICAYSMIINDYYDLEVDRINQPERPLPSGRLALTSALILAAVMLAIGLVSSLATGISVAVLVAAIYAFLSWVYNYGAKMYGLAGNLIVASSLAIPFIYGGVVAQGNISSLLIFMALTAFLAGVGREVVKAMADTEGDAKRRIRSFAITHGQRAASLVGALFFILAVAASQLPVVLGKATLPYLVGVIAPDVLFVYLAVSIGRKPSPQNALAVKRTALFGMLLGLMVFIIGAM
jgi:geranylgeranylglycerol-phosphate geranylgeranyltransferase